jgi:putative hydrolase of the HAD superfamily
MIKSIVFDLDNTLLDFMNIKRASIAAAVEAMIDAGLNASKKEMIETIFNSYGRDNIEDQTIFDKVLEKKLGKINYKILAAGIIGYRRAKEGMMTLYPHVRYTLSKLLRMNLKLGVISDAPKMSVWLRLVALDLHHYFDEVVTHDDTGTRKPSPEPFLLALKLLKAKPEETLMVGDWAERDIRGAKSIGMKTAWAEYGNEFETANSGADYDLKDISDLIKIVENENSVLIKDE